MCLGGSPKVDLGVSNGPAISILSAIVRSGSLDSIEHAAGSFGYLCKETWLAHVGTHAAIALMPHGTHRPRKSARPSGLSCIIPPAPRLLLSP